MGLNFNGVNIPDGDTFQFNAQQVERLFFNGVRVWTGPANVLVAAQSLIGPITSVGFSIGSFGTLAPGDFEGITVRSITDSFGILVGFSVILDGMHAQSVWTSIRVQGPGVDETRNSAAATYMPDFAFTLWFFGGAVNHVGFVVGQTYSITFIP